MAVPKKKMSPSRRDMRRAHHDKCSAPSLTTCSECGEPVLLHHACPACGNYKGRKVLDISADR